MIKKIEKSFGEEAKGSQRHKTAGTPGQGLIRVKEDRDKVNAELHSRFRTGTGTLSHLMKHSQHV